MQGSSIAIDVKRQTREQVAKFGERFYRNQRRAECELRTLWAQHPSRKGIDFAVGLAIDAVAVTVLAP